LPNTLASTQNPQNQNTHYTIMTSSFFLENFMEFFQCGGGQDLQEHIVMEEEPSIAPNMTSLPSPTSIYSMPSRESMTEVHRESINRFGASPLFALTSSPPMQFSFDDAETTADMEKRDDSLRYSRVRSAGGSQLDSTKRVNSMTTVSTADNSSIVDIRRTESEEFPEYQLQFVADRE
jgi:hypothetical protein